MMFFGTSIVPYSVFLYFLTKSKQAPGLLLFGFYFLLVFVFATIPAGILGAPSIIQLLFWNRCNIGLELEQMQARSHRFALKVETLRDARQDANFTWSSSNKLLPDFDWTM